MDLGIGRGDSARRVLGKPPITMANTEEAIRVIRALVAGESIAYEGTELAVPLDARLDAARLGRGLRADGHRHDRTGRRRAHPPARRPGPHPLVRRAAPRRRGRRGPGAWVGQGPGRGAGPRRPARPRPRADTLVPGARVEPRRRPREQVPARAAARGADRLHPRPRRATTTSTTPRSGRRMPPSWATR